MRFISWNINGIRAVAKKGFKKFLETKKPDILCLQEIKISDSARAQHEFDFSDYQEYWNSAQRPGYSGTAILIKNKKPSFKIPKLGFEVVKGIGVPEFDSEGRVQTLDLGKFFLVNTYFPNANHELSRLNYKISFNKAIFKYLKKLEKRKPVIIGGDFNVAHESIDLARPKDNEGNAGYTQEEREWMTKFLNSGFVDSFRLAHPQKQKFTWWTYRFQARARNIGWRIDYFCISRKLAKLVKRADILDEIQGSDHCPIILEI